MKIAYFGTGEFSKNILNGIFNFPEIDVEFIVSQPDKKIGRKRELKETEIKILAKEKGIKILQPHKIRDDILLINELKNKKLDFIIVVAYGQIISKEILDIPKYGCINMHGSILPSYRGASPIQESIKKGDKETGITIMYMNEKMDEGDIIDIKNLTIDKDDKTEDVFIKMEEIGPKFLINVLNKIVDGEKTGYKQDNIKATYCSKIKKEDGEVYFGKEKAQNIYNKYRAYSIWPRTHTYYLGKKLNIEECSYEDDFILEDHDIKDLIPGKVIKINKKKIGIICSDKKIIIINRVKLESKKTMDIISFVNGNKDFLDYKF